MRPPAPNRSAPRSWVSCATSCGGGQQEFNVANFVKLIDTRLQQDKLTEPRNDSAVYYLAQARAAGAGAAALQAQTQEINRRLAQTVRTDIDQRRFADADRLLADLRTYGVPASTLTNLQHDLTAARTQPAAAAAAAAAAPERAAIPRSGASPAGTGKADRAGHG